MAIDSANIGANFSNYEGNAALGGGSLGVAKIDTKPLEDLARYTMIYNKAEYDQRQKNADEKIVELAKLSTYDPSDSIPEERQDALDAYNEAVKAGEGYTRTTAATPQDKVKEFYDYKQKVKKATDKLDLLKARNLAFIKRTEDIVKEINVDAKEEKKRRLDEDVKRTKGKILPLEPKVDVDFPNIPDISTSVIDFFYKDPNTNQTVTIQLPNMRNLTSNSSLIETDFATKELDINSPRFKGLSLEAQNNEIYQSKLRSAYRKNGWIASADQVNQFINTKDANGKFIYKDVNGNVDPVKLKSAPAMIRNTIEQFDKYNQNMKAWKGAVTNKLFTNKESGKPQGFDNTVLFESDFDEINYNDNISGGEMAKVLMLANWNPKQLREVKAQQTNEAIAERGLALEAGRLGLSREELDFKKISAGWTKEGKKLVPPKAGAITGVNGVVPYWQNYILPQITSKNLLKNTKVTEVGKIKDLDGNVWKQMGSLPDNFSGDIPIKTDDISGLGIALFGELNDQGQQRGFTNQVKPSLRYQNGTAIGVVIDGVFYDQNDINSKATKVENRSIANKLDNPVFQEAQLTPAQIEFKKRYGL